MRSSDPAGLTRYWIEFVLPAPVRNDGAVRDGDTPLRRALGRGVGVTAHDVEDALDLVAAWLIEWEVLADRSNLPPVAAVRSPVDVAEIERERLGNPMWRGIWSPPDNLGGPAPLGASRR